MLLFFTTREWIYIQFSQIGTQSRQDTTMLSIPTQLQWISAAFFLSWRAKHISEAISPYSIQEYIVYSFESKRGRKWLRQQTLRRPFHPVQGPCLWKPSRGRYQGKWQDLWYNLEEEIACPSTCACIRHSHTRSEINCKLILVCFYKQEREKKSMLRLELHDSIYIPRVHTMSCHYMCNEYEVIDPIQKILFFPTWLKKWVLHYTPLFW